MGQWRGGGFGERTNDLGKGEWWSGEGVGKGRGLGGGAMLDTSPHKIYINITKGPHQIFFFRFFFSMDLSFWSDGGGVVVSIIFSSNPPTR